MKDEEIKKTKSVLGAFTNCSKTSVSVFLSSGRGRTRFFHSPHVGGGSESQVATVPKVSCKIFENWRRVAYLWYQQFISDEGKNEKNLNFGLYTSWQSWHLTLLFHSDLDARFRRKTFALWLKFRKITSFGLSVQRFCAFSFDQCSIFLTVFIKNLRFWNTMPFCRKLFLKFSAQFFQVNNCFRT